MGRGLWYFNRAERIFWKPPIFSGTHIYVYICNKLNVRSVLIRLAIYIYVFRRHIYIGNNIKWKYIARHWSYFYIHYYIVSCSTYIYIYNNMWASCGGSMTRCDVVFVVNGLMINECVSIQLQYVYNSVLLYYLERGNEFPIELFFAIPHRWNSFVIFNGHLKIYTIKWYSCISMWVILSLGMQRSNLSTLETYPNLGGIIF